MYNFYYLAMNSNFVANFELASTVLENNYIPMTKKNLENINPTLIIFSKRTSGALLSLLYLIIILVDL